jgi:hypothetical protein
MVAEDIIKLYLWYPCHKRYLVKPEKKGGIEPGFSQTISMYSKWYGKFKGPEAHSLEQLISKTRVFKYKCAPTDIL